ncbi:unnamed protein product [Dovyalis caffra]|uniref:Bromo domain-containing protein n=1 Tax=Dovyalis caffra TaxID=77055 RepID=A0AAV1RW52_9ROSI|nr:unnamed protein product [Dovyalis caffra]
MLSREQRRSPRIVELNTRKEEKEKSHIKGKETLELSSKRDLEQESSYAKSTRKKVKIRLVKDLVIDAIENQVEEAGSFKGEDHETAVIKEPMDFGTILEKLNGGCYKSLEDFERDVFLVADNAMLFNASNTIYYRQACPRIVIARAIKELAQKLFHALKTDPENFETKFSVRKLGSGIRTKAEGKLLNSNSSKTIEFETTSKGCKDKDKSGYMEVQRQHTYKPWTTFLKENELVASMVYNDSKALEMDVNNPINYRESFKQFTENLGPTANMVVHGMARRCFPEDVMISDKNSNQQLQHPIPYGETSSNLMQHALNIEQTAEAGSSQLRNPSFSSWSDKGTTEGLSRNQSVGNMDSLFGQGVHHVETLGNKEHPSYGNNLERDRILNLSKALGLGSQPRFNGWVEQKSRAEGTNSLGQAGPSYQQSRATNPGRELCEIPGTTDWEGAWDKGNLDQGKIPTWFQPVELGSQAMVDGRFQQQSKSSSDWLQEKSRLNGHKLSGRAGPSHQQSWANKPASGGGLYHIQGTANKGHLRYGTNSNQEDRLSKLIKPVELRPRTMVDSCFHQQSKLADGGLQQRSRYNGADLSGQDVLSHHPNRAINLTSGGGLYQSQPIVDSHFQQHSKSSEVNSSDQTGTSRGQQKHGWNITPSDREGMKASIAYNFEMCKTPWQGELSIGAPPSHGEKQPFPDANLLKWLLEN